MCTRDKNLRVLEKGLLYNIGISDALLYLYFFSLKYRLKWIAIEFGKDFVLFLRNSVSEGKNLLMIINYNNIIIIKSSSL